MLQSQHCKWHANGLKMNFAIFIEIQKVTLIGYLKCAQRINMQITRSTSNVKLLPIEKDEALSSNLVQKIPPFFPPLILKYSSIRRSIRNYFRSRGRLAKQRNVISNDIGKRDRRPARIRSSITSRRSIHSLFSPFSPHSPRLHVYACVSSARLRPTTSSAIAPTMIADRALSH